MSGHGIQLVQAQDLASPGHGMMTDMEPVRVRIIVQIDAEVNPIGVRTQALGSIASSPDYAPDDYRSVQQTMAETVSGSVWSSLSHLVQTAHVDQLLAGHITGLEIRPRDVRSWVEPAPPPES